MVRIELAGMNTEGLSLDLPPRGDVDPKIRVAETRNLRGLLSQSPKLLEISDVQAEAVLLDVLKLLFGTVLLEARGQTHLRGVGANVVQKEAGLDLRVALASLAAPLLRIEAGSVTVAGNTQFRNGNVTVSGSEGRIDATDVHVGAFYLGLTGVDIGAPELEAKRLVVSWGEDGFRLDAEGVQSTILEFKAAGTELRAEGVKASRLQVHRSDIAILNLEAAELRGELNLASARTDVPADVVSPENEDDQSETPKSDFRPIFDWRLLDTLGGRLHVDVGVDAKVPVIMRRRATHKLRVGLDGGTLNYRHLEHGLDSLEDALLDFSVRNDCLVLELGIPLIPTRGRGKPLVRWPLTEEGLELAKNHRVRVATLAHPDLQSRRSSAPPNDRPPGPARDSKPPVRLQRLAFQDIDADLNLTELGEDLESAFKSLGFDKLGVRGTVIHEPDGNPERTRLTVEFENLRANMDDLPLNDRKLDLEHCKVAASNDVSVDFDGARPVTIRLAVSGASIQRVGLGEFAE